MSSDAEAQDAIERLDGQDCDGRPMKVNEAKPQEKIAEKKAQEREQERNKESEPKQPTANTAMNESSSTTAK